MSIVADGALRLTHLKIRRCDLALGIGVGEDWEGQGWGKKAFNSCQGAKMASTRPQGVPKDAQDGSVYERIAFP